MGKIYKITPLEKKSIYLEMDFEKEVDGENKGFTAQEHYRFGVGYLPYESGAPDLKAEKIICDPDLGSVDYDEGVGTFFDCNVGEWSEEEKESLNEQYESNGHLYAFEEDGWNIERREVVVLSPFKFEVVDDETFEPIEG